MLRWTALAGFFALTVLHLDFWSGGWTSISVGWVPGELVYRLGWIVLAWLYLILFCHFIWRDEGDA